MSINDNKSETNQMFEYLKRSYKLSLISLAMFSLAFFSCGNGNEVVEEQKISEGTVYYKMTYPYYKDDFMVVLLPDLMTMEFKNNVYKNTVTKGGLFTTTLISDCNKQELIMMLDFGSKQIYTKLDKSLTDTMLLAFPIPNLLQVNAYDSLIGRKCDKFMAVYNTLEDGYDCEILTDKTIAIKNSNWCNPFKELPDVMLAYEASQYGLVSRFVTDSISTKPVNDEIFKIPAGFKEVSLEQMLFQMEEIFKQIIE